MSTRGPHLADLPDALGDYLSEGFESGPQYDEEVWFRALADLENNRPREEFRTPDNSYYSRTPYHRSVMSTHYADEAGLAEMLRRLMESFDSCYFEGCEYDEDEQLDYAEPPVDDQPHDLPWQPIQTPQLDEWTGLPLRGALRPGLAPPRTTQTPARPPVGAPAQRPAQRPAPTPAPQQPGMGQPVMINGFPVYPGMPGYPQNPTQSSRYGNTFDPVYYAGGVFERTPPGQPAKPRPSDSADWMQQLSHLSDWFERASIDSARGGHTHNLPDGYWNSPEHPFGQFQQLWGAPWGNRLRGYHPDGVGHLDESQMVGDVNAAFDFTHDYPMPGWEEMGMGEGAADENIEQIGAVEFDTPPPATEVPGLEFDFGPDDDYAGEPVEDPPPLEELDLGQYDRGASTPYLEHWSKPKTFMDDRLGMFPQRGWLGTEWWSAHPEDQGLMVTAFPTPSTGTRGYQARVSQVVPDGVEDVWRSSATGMTPEDLYREMLAEGLLPRVPAEWEHITEDVGGPHEQMYAAHYDYPADPNTPEGFVPDPVYPPGIFPPEAGPPAGFGAGFPPMQPYSATNYLDHWSLPHDFRDPRLGTMQTGPHSWEIPSDDPELITRIRQSLNPGSYLPSAVVPEDSGIGWETIHRFPSMPAHRVYPEMKKVGVAPPVDVPWGLITNDINPESAFSSEDQYPLDRYGRADYLAHPERPDRHDHHNSGFSPIRGTVGRTWTNEGLGGVPKDPNGIITELSQLGGGWTTTGDNNWGYTSYLPYVPGQSVEILDEQEFFPSKEELYRHLLTSGVISRQDIPPPAFEDLDLNRGMGQPTQYLPYAGVFERYDPSNPGKVAGVPGEKYDVPSLTDSAKRSMIAGWQGQITNPDDLAAWHEAWGGHDLTQPHRLQGAFEDAMTRWFPEENPTGYGDPIFDVDPEPIPPTSGIWDDIYADRNDQRHQQAAQAGTAWLGDGPRNFGFLRTGRRSGSATPMMPGFGPTGYAYGFDQNDMWSNPMSGTPQPAQPAQPGTTQPQQQSAVYPYPGTQAPQGMYPGDQMPGQMQPQAQQPMAGMPSAPATNPASMNPPNGQRVMPAQPPAPTFDQSGRPMAEMYDDSVDYNEECMYGPSTPEEWEAELEGNFWDGTGHAAFADWMKDNDFPPEEVEMRRLFGRYVTGQQGAEQALSPSVMWNLFRDIYADAKRNGWLRDADTGGITPPTEYADPQPVGPAQEFDRPLGTYTYRGVPDGQQTGYSRGRL